MITFLVLAALTVFLVWHGTRGALDTMQELDKPRTDYPRADPWRVGKGK